MMTAFISVWEELSEFLVGLFPDLIALFWTADSTGGGELTFIGVMAVVTAGIALVLLVFNLIRSFLTMHA